MNELKDLIRELQDDLFYNASISNEIYKKLLRIKELVN